MSRDRGGTKGRGQFCSSAELAQSRSGSVRRVRGGLDSWGRNWRWSAGWDRTLPIAWGEKVGMAILSVCIPVLAAGQTCRKGWCPGGLTDWMNELRVPVGGEPHSFISVVFFFSEGRRSLACYSPWGVRQDLETEQQQMSLSLTHTGGCTALAQWVSTLAAS